MSSAREGVVFVDWRAPKCYATPRSNDACERLLTAAQGS